MAKATKKKASKKGKAKTSRKSTTPPVYRMPKTAEELNVRCAECGAMAEWFDPERVSAALYATEKATEEHLRGFICSREPRSTKAQKLLSKEQGISERDGLAQSAKS